MLTCNEADTGQSPARKCADFRQVLNPGKRLDDLIFMVRIDDDCYSH
ncbi:MAG: hypothetical protein RBR67_21690 [Desulfobacterium sp.]|nr:hypothetical protein [Desulfobacterium sp.]